MRKDLPALETADGIAIAVVSVLIILSDWRDFLTPTRQFPHTFLPATSGAIHTLLVSCFADEERQRLDEFQVQARTVCLGAIVH